jgi:hypothetical protein
LEQLIKSLPAVLKATEKSDEVYSVACVAAWNYCVGESLRNNAVARSYEENRLTVAVADAVWQKQLRPMSDQLIYRLNSILGKRLVRTIEFKIAPDVVAEALRKRYSETKERSLSDLPPEIVSAACSIKDEHLRRAFLGAANSCLDRLKR